MQEGTVKSPEKTHITVSDLVSVHATGGTEAVISFISANKGMQIGVHAKFFLEKKGITHGYFS